MDWSDPLDDLRPWPLIPSPGHAVARLRACAHSGRKRRDGVVTVKWAAERDVLAVPDPLTDPLVLIVPSSAQQHGSTSSNRDSGRSGTSPAHAVT